MDPSVGRFITMDEYQGSIFDPVSLHKYLYANANPVMYTDPTGYYSLGQVTATLTVHSIVTGMVVGGVSLTALNSFIRFAKEEETTPGDYLKDFVQGALYGGVYRGLGVLAKEFLATGIILASANSWSTYSGISEGIDEFNDGNVMLGMALIGSSLGKPGKGKPKVTSKIAGDFEKSIVNLSPAERVATVKLKSREIAQNVGLVKDSKLSRINGRDVYKDPKTGDLYSVDIQHGRFEKANSKGIHQGEVDFVFKPTKPADTSGGHNIKVK